MTKYTLCHKDIPVLDCEFDGRFLASIAAVRDPAHVPAGCLDISGSANTGLLREWWLMRQIPPTRSNIKNIASSLGRDPFADLERINFGCSLSDQYWMKPYGSEISHRDVNFFENGFEPDLDRLFLSQEYDGFRDRDPGLSLATPSCSTGGDVPKAWVASESGVRLLYKSSGTAFGQEPYNEAIASLLGDLIASDHVDYGVSLYKGVICSACPCMIDVDQDIVPAYAIIKDKGRISAGPESDIAYYRQFAKEHGISDIDKHIGAMAVSDFLMRNTDRHWNNFGLIRDARTLEYIRPVPLFDFGNSLFHNHAHIDSRQRAASRFSGADLYHDLKYARGGNCPDISKIGEFPDIVRDVLKTSYIDGVRQGMLASFAEHRTEKLIGYLDDEYEEQKSGDEPEYR